MGRSGDAERCMLGKIMKKVCEATANAEEIELIILRIEDIFKSTLNVEGYQYIAPGQTGTVAPDFYSYSVFNVGSTDALLDGSILPAGVSVTFTAAGTRDTLQGLSYDSQATTLIITTIIVP